MKEELFKKEQITKNQDINTTPIDENSNKLIKSNNEDTQYEIKYKLLEEEILKLKSKIDEIDKQDKQVTLETLVETSTKLYEKGHSALDILYLLENPSFLKQLLTDEKRYELLVCFHRVRREFRNEKLLFLFILHFIFLSSELCLENISFM